MRCVFIAVLLHIFQWGKELGQQHLFPGTLGEKCMQTKLAIVNGHTADRDTTSLEMERPAAV